MSTSSSNLDKELLDRAAKLAAYAKIYNLNPTQINNYIEFFNSLKGGKESYLYFAAYVVRQGSRIRGPREFIQEFMDAMIKAYEDDIEKEKIVVMLNTFKWLFESARNLGIRFDRREIRGLTIETFLRKFASGR